MAGVIRKLRLQLFERDESGFKRHWRKVPGHLVDFNILSTDDSDAIWIAIEDRLAELMEVKKASYEGRKTRQ